MLIDTSYFKGDLQIVDLADQSTQDNLLYFIGRYETEFLELWLGKSLYNAYAAGIKEDPIDQKWLDLQNGVDYYVNGDLRTWQGFKREIVVNEALTVKLSPIANYVYYYYTRNLHQQMTSIAVVKNKGENSFNVSPDLKLQKAWNDMVLWVREGWQYIYHNNVTYDTMGWPVSYNDYWTGYFPYAYNPFGIASIERKKRQAIGEMITNGL